MKPKSGTQTGVVLQKQILKDFKIQYLLYLPDGYSRSRRKWPMIIFLHGSDERGDNLEKVKIHGLPKLIEKGKSFPFIIVSPQCPRNGWWPQEIEALDLLFDEIVDHYRVDESRIYLTGLSMGGYGVWAFALNYPDRFAAIAPICGGGDSRRAGVLKNVPAWVFHGADDTAVPLHESQKMAEALKKAGGKVKFTVYPQTGHDSWSKTYKNPKLYQWFLSQRK